MKTLPAVIPHFASGAARVAALALCAGLFVGAIACGVLPGNSSSADDTAGQSPAGGNPAIASEFQVRGELIFNRRADIAFEVGGEVGAVNVAIGDQVAAGDVLATLDTDTLSMLERRAAQARFDLEAAQDGLDLLLGLQSDDPLVQARAESALAAAELALERAQDDLDDYQFTHNVQLGAARQAVADAEANIDRAEEAVADFAGSYSETFAQALAVRSKARTDLAAAQDAVTDFLPRHDESVSRIKTQIAQAESVLDTARKVVRDFDAEHADRLAAARQKLARAEVDVSTAEDAFSDFQVRIIEGRPMENVDDGENFDVVQHKGLLAAVSIARQAVITAQNELDELLAGPKEVDRTAAIARVTELEATLLLLNRELNDALAGPDQDELRRLEAAVELGRSTLARADRDLAEAEEGVDQLELARLQAAAEGARFNLESARTQLARLEEGLDPATLDSLTKAVTTATEARDDLTKDPDAAAIALANAGISAASTAHETALEDLENAMLRAPFAGVIRVLTIKTGDVITLDARVMQIVDPRDVAVLGRVESNYVARIAQGTPAAVTLAALPGVVFDAQVVEISEDARTERGIISFPTLFEVQVPPNVVVPSYPGLVTTTVRQ